MITRRAVVIVSVLFLLPACTGSRNSAGSSSRTTVPRVPSAEYSISSVAEITPDIGWVESLATWDHFVAWVGQSAESHARQWEPDQVVLHDLRSRRTHIVARTRFPNGTIRRVRGNGDTLVFVDQASVTTAERPTTAWELYAFSISTGQARLLAASKSARDQAVTPLPNIVEPWVVWYRANDSEVESVAIVAVNLHTAGFVTIVQSANVGQLTIEESSLEVYYDDDNESGGRDIYRVSLQNDRVVSRVTTQGDVGFPVARNAAVVWQRIGTAGSYSLWYKPVSGEALSVNDDAGVTNAVPGDGFVIWADGASNLVVGDPLGQRTVKQVAESSELDTAARWAVSDRRIVWSTVKGYGQEQQSAIHVAEVII